VESASALLPFVIILLAFYLLLIRPARTRARQQQQLQSSLAVGQEVMTTSGLYATVVAVEDDAVLLEASPGTHTRWAKQAVARVLGGEAVADADDVADEDSPATREDGTGADRSE
jgi:preprotein translocase subunit YajC